MENLNRAGSPTRMSTRHVPENLSSQHGGDDRDWLHRAIRRIEADFQRSADTHLIRLDELSREGLTLYLKDESTHPTGSLKHRLARSLFLYALCNGWLREGQTVIEASSGSTAISEAYFARLIGCPFIAVVPRGTAVRKIEQIEFYGGECRLVDDPCEVDAECRRLAADLQGHFIDQFTYAERATDWRGNNNIAESIFAQMSHEPHPTPAWIVVGAGTGGTSATIGRYIRYRQLPTRLACVDPERSVFAEHFRTGRTDVQLPIGSRIEGIGRPRVERSFVRQVVDEMITVPDAASMAAMRFLSDKLGRRCGGSTGTNLWGCMGIMARMAAAQETGSIVTLLCDAGERYADTYYQDDWVAEQGLNLAPYLQQLEDFFLPE